MFNNLTALAIIITLVAYSCKNKNDNAILTQTPELIAIKNLYEKDKSDSTFLKLMQTFGSAIRDEKDSKIKTQYLVEAIDICFKENNENMMIPFQEELNRVSPNSERNAEFLFDMGEKYAEINEVELADIFYSGLITRFPKDSKTLDIKGRRKITTDGEKYIERVAKKTFDNPDSLGMNFKASQHYIETCKTFVMAYPEHKSAAEYLFRAAEMNRAYGQYVPMMYFYNWITDFYPDYAKMPIVLFTKGFMLETQFNRYDDALQTYKLFLEKFPNDELAPQAQLLIDNIGINPIENDNATKKPQ